MQTLVVVYFPQQKDEKMWFTLIKIFIDSKSNIVTVVSVT